MLALHAVVVSGSVVVALRVGCAVRMAEGHGHDALPDALEHLDDHALEDADILRVHSSRVGGKYFVVPGKGFVKS